MQKKLSFGMFVAILAGCIQVVQPPAPRALASVQAVIPASVQASPSPVVAAASPGEVPTEAPVMLPNLSKIKMRVIYSLSHTTWLMEKTGVDPKYVLRQLSCGLGAKHVTIVLSWDWVKDKSPGTFEGAYNIDSLLDIVKSCGVESVTVAFGRKSQHWPECHDPSYVKDLSESEYKAQILAYDREVASYLATEPIVTEFQVENEPVDEPFGICRTLSDSDAFLAKEVAEVRAADKLGRPIVITARGRTADGRWGKWKKAATFGNRVLITFYSIWYLNGEYGEYPNGNPEEWRAQAMDAGPDVQVGELQIEPVSPTGDYRNISHEESLKSASPERMRRNLKFVLDAGFTEVGIWGGEWAYHKMRVKNEPAMWEALDKEVFVQ